MASYLGSLYMTWMNQPCVAGNHTSTQYCSSLPEYGSCAAAYRTRPAKRCVATTNGGSVRAETRTRLYQPASGRGKMAMMLYMCCLLFSVAISSCGALADTALSPDPVVSSATSGTIPRHVLDSSEARTTLATPSEQQRVALAQASVEILSVDAAWCPSRSVSSSSSAGGHGRGAGSATSTAEVNSNPNGTGTESCRMRYQAALVTVDFQTTLQVRMLCNESITYT